MLYLRYRKAEQQKYIRELDNGDKQYFCIDIDHRNGKYAVAFRRETHQNNGFVSFIPLDNENGWGTIKVGRYNQNFLGKCDRVLEQNLDKYFNYFIKQDKQGLFNQVYTDINAIK